VKGVESANYQIYYSGEDNNNIYCDPMLELDKAEILCLEMDTGDRCACPYCIGGASALRCGNYNHYM